MSDVEFPQKKLNGAPSVNNVLNSARTTENGNTEFGRAAVWAVSFDHLLNDTAGLATFTVRSASFLSALFSYHLCVWQLRNIISTFSFAS